MLAGTFLSWSGCFMVWPYLSVELYRQFQLSASPMIDSSVLGSASILNKFGNPPRFFK
ncbi:hypothetical protein XIS1_120013 [Xenorhabdus innexi]|uniref:Uncharacterized protein n=1 Tax=Xenorhabdus innexi TaxID=290109 RepID=A0A1N6MRY6_9GAMM|nr:hypothetical protein XIS1_120013 [Xenorhabdus innexi]